MKNSGKKIICGLVACAMAISVVSPAFAASKGVALTNDYIQMLGTTEYPEGGIWYHDVSHSGSTKSVVSNYSNTNKEHKASCDIGGYNKDSSEWLKGSNEAKSSTSGNSSLGTAHAYYDTK